MATGADDLERYVLHLQGQLLTPGFEEFFSPDRLRLHVRKLRERGRGEQHPAGFLESLERDVSASTHYVFPAVGEIFPPLVESLLAVAGELGVAPKRRVHVRLSTDVSPSAAVLPSAGEHLLFAGPGTSAFCNYWAKVFLVASHTMAGPELGRVAKESAQDRLTKKPIAGLLALRLAMHHALHGTALGFGELKDEEWLQPARAHILRAMESFVMAHELAHIICEERGESASTGKRTAFEEETVCDRLAFALCRAHDPKEIYAFAGAGACIFFHCYAIVERSRDRLLGAHAPSTTHPDTRTRLAKLRCMLEEATHSDDLRVVLPFFDEVDVIGSALAEWVDTTLEAATKAAGIDVPLR